MAKSDKIVKMCKSVQNHYKWPKTVKNGQKPVKRLKSGLKGGVLS